MIWRIIYNATLVSPYRIKKNLQDTVLTLGPTSLFIEKTNNINFHLSFCTAWLRSVQYVAEPDIRRSGLQKKPLLKPDF